MFQSFLTTAMHGTSSHYNIPTNHIFWDVILLNTLQASSAMRPHFAWMKTKILPKKTSQSHDPLSMRCPWAHLCCSTEPWWHVHLVQPQNLQDLVAHSLASLAKISSSAFCQCLHFTCTNIMVVQVTTFQDSVASCCKIPSISLQNPWHLNNNLIVAMYMSIKLL